jgi:hypothetical protein
VVTNTVMPTKTVIPVYTPTPTPKVTQEPKDDYRWLWWLIAHLWRNLR